MRYSLVQDLLTIAETNTMEAASLVYERLVDLGSQLIFLFVARGN